MLNPKSERTMILKEFEDRTGFKPTSEEFDYIHDVYMHTSMNKDEFCKDFKKHGDSKIIRDVHVRAINFELMNKQKDERMNELAAFLIGKSRAYDDSDFRRMAVRLIGEQKVVLQTVEMNLPLWEEDKEFIKTNLK